VLSKLETLASGGIAELILHTLEVGPLELKALAAKLPAATSENEFTAALQQLFENGDVLTLVPARTSTEVQSLRPADLIISASQWAAIVGRITVMVTAFHKSAPLRKGMPREELRSRLQLPGLVRVFDEVIALAARQGSVVDDGSTIHMPEFRITLDPDRRRLADGFVAALRSAPFAPPSPAEHWLDPDTLGALVDLGEVVKVADGVVYDPAAYARIERDVVELLDRAGSITIASYRDHFQSSRKYAQATLEYMDQRRITRRVGDERVRYIGPGAGRPGGDQ
jgi:selenocysteine-specific elongation factor